MRLLDRPIAAAKLLGGRLCLDFVNTCGGRTDEGRPIDDRLLEFIDLATWANRAAIETGPAVHRMVAEAMRDHNAAARIHERSVLLREACYRMLRGVIRDNKPPSACDVTILNREWTEAIRHRALAAGSAGLQLKWTGDALDRPLWAVAESAVQLLASPDSSTQLRECGGLDCGWLFEDSSRNQSRQWCDMQTCGTVSKVRRFRERQKEQ